MTNGASTDGATIIGNLGMTTNVTAENTSLTTENEKISSLSSSYFKGVNLQDVDGRI
jgi:hypothetical protein